MIKCIKLSFIRQNVYLSLPNIDNEAYYSVNILVIYKRVFDKLIFFKKKMFFRKFRAPQTNDPVGRTIYYYTQTHTHTLLYAKYSGTLRLPRDSRRPSSAPN